MISGKNGEIGGGDDNNELDFELKTRGDLRYNSTVAFTNLTYHFGGIFYASRGVFLSGVGL